MFGWLRSLLQPRSKDVVFCYDDGSELVEADPLKLRSDLDAAFPQWANAADELVSIDRTAAKLAAAGMQLGEKLTSEADVKRERLVGELVRAVRAAFRIPSRSGAGRWATGRTDIGCLDVLAAYLAWVSDVMEDTRPLAKPPEPLGSVPAASPGGNPLGSPSMPGEFDSSGMA